MRTLPSASHDAVGLDLVPGPWTQHVGSIADRDVVRGAIEGCDAVIHTATLHKPHVATHGADAFVNTNVLGTLHLLEEAIRAGCGAFIFTSTTSTFGRALVPPPGAPAAWITEDVCSVPKNIYGVTKVAAEDLCELHHFRHGLPCIILRTSRFFPEEDDNPATRNALDDRNAKVNELLCRRLDIEDAVQAHVAALERAPAIGFGRYIVSATTPFSPEDLPGLRNSPGDVLARHVDFTEDFERLGWRLFEKIDRVYCNDRARRDLAWEPNYTFAHALERLREGRSPFSDLMHEVGSKGYHPGQTFKDGPFPVA